MPGFDLGKIPLFDGLTKKELSIVSDFLLPKNYSQNTAIFTKGTIRDRLLIVTGGLVSLQSDIDHHETIALFKAGDIMGEMALIEKNGRHQHGLKVVSEELTVLELSLASWYTIVKNNRQIPEKIYKNIASDLKNKLNHANNKLVTLYATGKIIGDYDNLENIAASILKIVLKIIPSERALFALYPPDLGKIIVQASVGWANIKKNVYFDIESDQLLQKIIKNPSTVIFQKNNWPKGADELIYKSERAIITPIHLKKKVFGFIILGDKSNQKSFSDNNKILLEAIASQVAPAIEEISLEKLKSAEEDVEKVYIDPFAKI